MDPMPKIASIFRSSLCLAAVLTVALPASQAAALECADKELSARRPTFTPSPQTPMEAAKEGHGDLQRRDHGDGEGSQDHVRQPGAVQQLHHHCRAVRRDAGQAQSELTLRLLTLAREGRGKRDEALANYR